MMSRACSLGHLQHAFDHRQRVGVEQIALDRRVQQLDQLLAVLGLAHQQRAEALEQARFGGFGSLAVRLRRQVAQPARAHRDRGYPSSHQDRASRGASMRARPRRRARGRSPAGAACRARPGGHSARARPCPAARASRAITGAHSTMSPAERRRRRVDERQHVGGVVLAAELAVEAPRLRRSSTMRSVTRASLPASAARAQRRSLRARRQCRARARRVLHGERELSAPRRARRLRRCVRWFS